MSLPSESVVLLAACVLLVGCDRTGSNGTGIVNAEAGPGELQVTTKTTGTNFDKDGYLVSISTWDGSKSIDVDETIIVENLNAEELDSASFELKLDGVVEQCSVEGKNPRSVTIDPKKKAAITFEVRCTEDNTVYIDTQSDFEQYHDAEFSAGTQVLFKAGAIFDGQFRPTGSGSSGAPITVTAYNPDSGTIYTDWIENKPIINGHGEVNATVGILNGSYWEINNLEVTNTDGTEQDQGDLRGIHIVAQNTGVVNHIVIKNSYVHNVNGRVAGKQRGGIHFNSYGTNTLFNGVIIKDNVVKNVGGVGIANQSDQSSHNPGDSQYLPWKNMIIKGNRIVNTGRNSIIFRISDSTIVENNTSVRSSLYGTGHSIVNFNTVDAIMQYNEAYGNTGKITDNERGGFDADYNSVGTIIQYNYSHDNLWFCGIMRRSINKNPVIRYNISQDELMGSYLYGFPSESGLENAQVYHNVHYFSEHIDGQIFVGAGRTRHPIETVFANNIWYFEGEGQIGEEPAGSTVFRNNLFYNVDPIGQGALTANPMFINPGEGGTDIDMTDPDRLAGYRLQSGSPAIDAGFDELKEIDNGGQDFWGNPIYNGDPDIGAFEAQ